MRRLLLTFAMVFAAAMPAHAHKLRVFATVVADEISGYAFFVGGGRAAGTEWSARMGTSVIAEGQTDATGGFRLSVPADVTTDIEIRVDTREGHSASAILPLARFAEISGAAQVPPAPGASARVDAETPAEAPVPPAAAEPGADPAALAALIEAAVARQVAPLQAQIAELQDRLRFVDIVSGLMFIAGLAGLGLWARARRQP